MDKEIIMQSQARYFENLWQRENKKLNSHNVEPAIMENGVTVPVDHCISTLARVVDQANGRETAESIHKHALDLLGLVTDNQFVYPVESFHISVVGCTPRRDDASQFTGREKKRILKLCEEATDDKSPVKVSFRGLGIIGNQVFLQGYALDDGWIKIREAVTNKLEGAGEHPIAYPDKSPIHMNILRIVDVSGNNLDQIAQILDRSRDIDFGVVEFDSIGYVVTDFVLSKQNFDLISKISLDR